MEDIYKIQDSVNLNQTIFSKLKELTASPVPHNDTPRRIRRQLPGQLGADQPGPGTGRPGRTQGTRRGPDDRPGGGRREGPCGNHVTTHDEASRSPHGRDLLERIHLPGNFRTWRVTETNLEGLRPPLDIPPFSGAFWSR